MVNRFSHGVEVQYERWSENHCKVEKQADAPGSQVSFVQLYHVTNCFHMRVNLQIQIYFEKCKTNTVRCFKYCSGLVDETPMIPFLVSGYPFKKIFIL